ncbi:sulfite exporter TauE/SafE family protein, partial [Alcaligenes pakistanensis]
MALAIILGVLTGLSLGLTGAGGGILAVPALVLGMGYSMTAATPVAL